MKILHDDFGNTATIEEKMMYSYKGAEHKTKFFVLSLTADYEDDFMYFRSVYESMGDAMEKLKEFSCNTWK